MNTLRRDKIREIRQVRRTPGVFGFYVGQAVRRLGQLLQFFVWMDIMHL
jgi:hypothetical protein